MKNKNENIISYTDDEYIVQVEVLPGWKIIKNFHNMKLFIYKEDENYLGNSNFNFMVIDNKNNSKISQVLRRTKIDVYNDFENFSLVQMESINEYSGWFSCKGMKEKKMYYMKQFIYLIEKKIYSFTSCCLESYRNNLDGDFNRVFSSIEINKNK
ncbi:hypothetical protein LOR37_23365 (plasmid) [Clostridium estertheticum]|uniref:hypothetical protein n=1 Tax=Clostridium estertheticum TaxID=238834 RepID=UPI0022DD7313|nr:hypothetical protein [Clostridium estertheticum]WBL49662.1 hypothetical protein LOR37_23365 [Clostridium estertheticum]